jgi:hypothetical protein
MPSHRETLCLCTHAQTPEPYESMPIHTKACVNMPSYTLETPYLEARDPVGNRQRHQRGRSPQAWPCCAAATTTNTSAPSSCCRAVAACCPDVVHLQAMPSRPAGPRRPIIAPSVPACVPPAAAASTAAATSPTATSAAAAAPTAAAAGGCQPRHQPPVVQLHAHAGLAAAAATAPAGAAEEGVPGA